MGYHEVERGELPLKTWKDCLALSEIPGVRRNCRRQVAEPDASLAARRASRTGLVQLADARQN